MQNSIDFYKTIFLYVIPAPVIVPWYKFISGISNFDELISFFVYEVRYIQIDYILASKYQGIYLINFNIVYFRYVTCRISSVPEFYVLFVLVANCISLFTCYCSFFHKTMLLDIDKKT